jgi:DNA-binding NarL/FixJ family response regulator
MDTEKAPHETLSDREFQTLTMIASGFSVGDIAEKLSLSVKTISMYRTRMLEKMQLRHNADLTHYAIKNNLVD